MASPLSLLAPTFQSWASILSLSFSMPITCFSSNPFHKHWAYLIVGCMGVCTGKTSGSSARRKKDEVPILVKKQEVKHGLTQAKFCAPYIFYTHLLAADPVVTWPQSVHIVLRNSWEMANSWWKVFLWKLRSATCFWWHLGFYLYYHIKQAWTKSLALGSKDPSGLPGRTCLNLPPPAQTPSTMCPVSTTPPKCAKALFGQEEPKLCQ